MQVFRDIEAAREFLANGSVVTIGNYDGIHLGHQTIIRETVERAHAAGLKSALVTFDPHPHSVLVPSHAPKLLTTTDEKIALLSAMTKLDAVVILHFDPMLAQVSAAEFLEEYLLGGLSCLILVIGYNHAFGHNREGNIAFLRRMAPRRRFQLVTLDPILFAGAPVNSSRVRETMQHGDYTDALRMLGHEFTLSGRVVRGKGIGRSLGFPTINVKIGGAKIIPPAGVYAAYTLIRSEKRFGMMYIGENAQDFDFEVNLFDYSGDLYGSEVTVIPTAFIRRAIRFEQESDLVRQIGEDEKTIRMLDNRV
ncbi:MAG: riboflavin biosynthesis protein RibF [candidate division Zixibacteria bacterium]|nr:riboflavin biosynthesis protein RibF [candidate division Zixibacteria bacterium]